MIINEKNYIRLAFATSEQFSFALPEGGENSTFKLSIRKTPEPNTASMCDAAGTVSGNTVNFSLNTRTAEFQRLCRELANAVPFRKTAEAWLQIYDDAAGKIFLQRKIDYTFNAGTLDGQVPAPVDSYLKNPSGGSAGQVLKKTASGVEWANEQSGNSITSVNGKTGAVTLDTSDISMPVVALAGTAVPKAGQIYTHTVAAGETFTFFTPASGVDNLFELWITQPSIAVSFTLPANITWGDGAEFSSTQTAPDLSTANKLYCLVFRWNGTRLLGNLAYSEVLS